MREWASEGATAAMERWATRSEEHTSELQSPCNLVCRLLLEKKKIHFLGSPLFPAAVEFIASLISYYVPPVNIHLTCLLLACATFTTSLHNGFERRVYAPDMF